jgi:Flp pilus assembly pilin Flp
MPGQISRAVPYPFKESVMRHFVRKLLESQSGQGMTEYLIIVALIAIAAVGVVTVFGRDIRELFSGTTDDLAGNQATNSAQKARVNKAKSLKTSGKYNAAPGD